MKVNNVRMLDLEKRFRKEKFFDEKKISSVWFEYLSNNGLSELLGKLVCVGKLMGMNWEEIESMIWEESEWFSEWNLRKVRDIEEILRVVKIWMRSMRDEWEDIEVR